MIPLLLTRWRWGLSIFAALAMLGAMGAAIHYRGAYRAEKALRAADRALYAAAQVEAGRIAQEALHATEAKYAAKARKADHEYAKSLEGARVAADRYIASHRVRIQATGGSSGSAIASAEDHGSGVPETLPEVVVMDGADVHRGTEWQQFGTACHNMIIGLAE